MTSHSTRSLKRFVLIVALWMPLGFFVWFFLRSLFVAPVYLLTSALLTGMMPAVFAEVEVTQHLLTIVTRLQQTLAGGARGVLELTVNPMVYGYGLPLLASLVAATPLSGKRRLLQILVGAVVVSAIQVWGSIWEALKLVAFETGPAGRAAIDDSGLSADGIAIAYQLGTLILPALVPVMLWVLMNRTFIEWFVRKPRP